MSTEHRDNANQLYIPPTDKETIASGTRVVLVDRSGSMTPNATMVGGTVVPDKKD